MCREGEREGGGGGSSAWVTACLPYLLTLALRSGESSETEGCLIL